MRAAIGSIVSRTLFIVSASGRLVELGLYGTGEVIPPEPLAWYLALASSPAGGSSG